MPKKDISKLHIVDNIQLAKVLGKKFSKQRCNQIWDQLCAGTITDQDIIDLATGNRG